MQDVCFLTQGSDNIAGLIPRGLGKSKQLVITERHLPSSGDLEARDPQQYGCTGSFVCHPRPAILPGGCLLRSLLSELPCWVRPMRGTGRKSLSRKRMYQGYFFLLPPCFGIVSLAAFPSFQDYPMGEAPLSQPQPSLVSGATVPFPCPLTSDLMAFHDSESVWDPTPSVCH